MIRKIVTLIIFVLTVSSVAYPQNDDPFKRVKDISNFVYHGLALSPSTSVAKIRALGRVTNVVVEQYEDRGIISEKRTYYLDGLQVVAHFAKGDDSSGAITEAVVTGSK